MNVLLWKDCAALGSRTQARESIARMQGALSGTVSTDGRLSAYLDDVLDSCKGKIRYMAIRAK